jgi:hypothetical protein
MLCPQFELKKSLVDHLVQLLSCGHVLPVVDYVAHCMEMESLDQSHIRHFVAEVGMYIKFKQCHVAKK